MKRYVSKFPEAKQVGILYHYTSLQGLLNIIRTNHLRASTPNNKFVISFTRDKNFHKSNNRYIGSMQVSIIIDGNKLSNKYKITPYQDLATKADVITNKLKWDKESEETVVGEKGITNIKNYILGVRIHPEFIPDDSDILLNTCIELLNKEKIKILK